jgi:Holliday junction resolvasome RuvABC endonuclease subunit
VLAIDPGMREIGYAVLSRNTLITSGVLSLRTVPHRGRLAKVQEALVAWIRAYRPRVLVIEHMPNRPLDSIAGLPALGRLVRRFARGRRLRLVTYSATTVRRSVIGDGWASKRIVAKTLTARFPALRVHLTQDRKWKERYWQNMFDAVALALHHQTQSPPSRGR